jgi:hypothetical protein
MDKIFRHITFKIFLLVVLMMPAITTLAQCPMCKMSAEQSDIRRNLNTGILYLLAFPFLLMGGAMLWWYLNRSKFENPQN